MPSLESVSFTIAADGAFTTAVTPGQRYAFGASSASWAGSLAIGWTDEAGNVTAFPDSPLTANGGFEFVSPGKVLTLTASGSIGTTRISLAQTRP
jgi:hypothetical protein